MMEKFNERWGQGASGTVVTQHLSQRFRNICKGIPRVVLISAALDPRSKHLLGIPEEEREKVWDIVKEELLKICKANLEIVPEPAVQQRPLEIEDDEIFGGWYANQSSAQNINRTLTQRSAEGIYSYELLIYKQMENIRPRKMRS
jgi:hypothetical protein